jgi:outer membrane protein assembly factor BamE (lipoprotein component of BamABCDE complex)
MSLRLAKASVVATILAVALAGCTSSTALVTQRTQGYVIPSTALQQIRPGQSQQTVQLVLGSPQSTNTFGDQTAWYYVETKVNQTSFGFTQIKERTVLAVYFDKSKKVSERAVYSLQDGRAIDIETRRTPSFGQDATFIDSILSSF